MALRGSGVKPGIPAPGEPLLNPWANDMQQPGRGADAVPRSGPVAEVDGRPLVALSQPGRRADGSEAEEARSDGGSTAPLTEGP